MKSLNILLFTAFFALNALAQDDVIAPMDAETQALVDSMVAQDAAAAAAADDDDDDDDVDVFAKDLAAFLNASTNEGTPSPCSEAAFVFFELPSEDIQEHPAQEETGAQPEAGVMEVDNASGEASDNLARIERRIQDLADAGAKGGLSSRVGFTKESDLLLLKAVTAMAHSSYGRRITPWQKVYRYFHANKPQTVTWKFNIKQLQHRWENVLCKTPHIFTQAEKDAIRRGHALYYKFRQTNWASCTLKTLLPRLKAEGVTSQQIARYWSRHLASKANSAGQRQ